MTAGGCELVVETVAVARQVWDRRGSGRIGETGLRQECDGEDILHGMWSG
jgi:hypothetical protein